ncbi:MAG: 4Fe-4S dicluster domain-containing protein [Chloroflexi bacterium]|nr:4Fe-4S dicluster domain-containing protein [Chloroflexota bacterium]
MFKKIGHSEIAKLLSEWSKESTVLVPTRADGVTTWAKWDGRDVSFLDWYRNTVVPPKSFLLPMLEEMFRFQKGKDGYSLELPPSDGRKQVIFGIRPCDARALAIIDLVFREGYEDLYYVNRRNNTTLVGLACTSPYDSCFCTSLGSGPGDARGVDLMLTTAGDQLLIEEVTDKGKELTAGASGLGKAAEADLISAREAVELASRKVTRQVDLKDTDKALLANFEKAEFWEDIAAKCVSCGICTFLCPTCYCFDINDEMDRQGGARVKSWDSCQFALYTRMPMENPRVEKWRRVRQKVSHKFLFYPLSYETTGCVGCGRCIRRCPVNWDITQVLNSLTAKVA